MQQSEQIAWATVAIVGTIVAGGAVYIMNSRKSVSSGPFSLILLLIVILAFTIGIGFVVNTQVYQTDVSTQRAGIQASIGQVWPLVIIATGLMATIIQKYGITMDSMFYFFAAYIVLFFCTLMMAVVYINKSDELHDDTTVIDTTQTNIMYTALTSVIVGTAIFAIIS